MHQVEIRFQFAPLEVTLLAGGAARATAPGGAVLHVVPFGPVPLQAAVRAGREAPIEGWISRDYGRRVAAPVLVYSALARLPFRVITLLHPGEVPGEAAPVVRPIGRSAAGPIGIVFEATGESVRFDAEGCALGRG
jgi:hypothetical protein